MGTHTGESAPEHVFEQRTNKCDRVKDWNGGGGRIMESADKGQQKKKNKTRRRKQDLKQCCFASKTEGWGLNFH